MWPAQALEVAVVISATICFGNDMVNGLCGSHSPFTLTLLTQVFVTRQYQRAQLVPLHTITSLMPALALLVGFPSGVDMVRAIA
jgi:hypothetical protein